MTVTTPTAAAMFQSMGRSALTRVAAPSEMVCRLAGIDDVERHEELVPDEDRAEQRGRDEPGRTIGSMTRQSSAETAAAVHHRRIVDLPRHLVEEADHDPDDQRQRERDIGQDQAENVSWRPTADHQVDGDGHGHGGHEPEAEDGATPMSASPERSRENA